VVDLEKRKTVEALEACNQRRTDVAEMLDIPLATPNRKWARY
jgi:hypothetical protein